MNPITKVAERFFEACETGEGWEQCKEYCLPNATFSAQAEPLAGMNRLEDYCAWTRDLLVFIPNGSYELKSFATDDSRGNVVAYAVFHGTHTDDGGPCPPTGKSTSSDYVYVMEFDSNKIRHMTKIWHAGLAMKELGWV